MSLCLCGCGQDAGVYSRTNTNDGAVKGQPKLFVSPGHSRYALNGKNEKHPLWQGNSVGYGGLHKWVKRHFEDVPCEHCGAKEKLQWAMIHGHEMSRNRNDWLHLCCKCHGSYDRDYVAGCRHL